MGQHLCLFHPTLTTPQKLIDKTGTAGKVGSENEKNPSGSFNITTASIAWRNFNFHESDEIIVLDIGRESLRR